jgi:hypothetical protein
MQLLGLLAVILIDPEMYATRKTVKRNLSAIHPHLNSRPKPSIRELEGLPEHHKNKGVTDGNHPGPAPSK